MIDINELENALDWDKIDPKYKTAAQAIVDSANDWPETVKSLDEFLLSLEQYFGKEAYLDDVVNAKNNIDVIKEAWRAESLAYLLEVFLLGDTSGLRQIFCSVSKYFSETIANIDCEVL